MEGRFLVWGDDFATGHDGLDAEHRGLVAAINQVNLAGGVELTNLDILAMTAEEERQARFAWAWQIANGAVGVTYRSYESKEGMSGLFQAVSLPYSDVKEDGSHYFLIHTNWRPTSSDWIKGNVTADLNVPSDRTIISFKKRATESADTANRASLKPRS